MYIKLGQIAATRVDLLPREVCDELAELQNRVAPSRGSASRRCSRPSSADRSSEVFAEFDWEPLAAASIGQTYRARLHSGEPVVVKVQRPDIEELMERDLAALGAARRPRPAPHAVRPGSPLRRAAGAVRRRAARRARLPPRGRRDDRDGDAAARARRRCASRRCTASCPAAGCSCRSASKASRSPRPGDSTTVTIDRATLADQLLRATLDQIMRIGLFHADPAPGQRLRPA